MRTPVVGRKTWYGNHSKKGAMTSAILFSILESCKLNNMHPRIFFKEIVQSMHQGQEVLTSAEYAKITDSKK